jgi:hypothetical protein
MTYRQKRERPENWKEYKTRTHRVWAPPILAVKWLEECWQGKPQTAAQSHGSKPSCGAEARSIPAHNQAGWKARKHPAGEKYFFLTFPFI